MKTASSLVGGSHSRKISTSKNKIKTTWNIVKSETGRKIDIEKIPTISYIGL
jgi:hypothetical protein